MTYRHRKQIALILAAPVVLPFFLLAALCGLLWLGVKSWARIAIGLSREEFAEPVPPLRPEPPVDPVQAARISPPSSRAYPPPGDA